MNYAEPVQTSRKRRCPPGVTLAEKLAFYSLPAPNGCRLWSGYKNSAGYGWLRWGGQRRRRAHRLALELKLGRALGLGMESCHSCDVPGCIEPGHLFEGTQADNINDAHRKGRLFLPPALHGERNASAKLNATSARAIRRDARRQVDIAAAYGVSQTTVSQIKRGQTWRLA